MKVENYKLRLRRARKLAIRILESSGFMAFEVTDRKNQFGIIAINPATGIAKIVWVCLETEKIPDSFDRSIPYNLEQEVWVKRPYLNEFKVII